MPSNNCKCVNIEEAQIILKDQSTQTVRYCNDCGKVQNNVNVEPEETPVQKTWAERKRDVIKREPQKLSWAERRARRTQRSTATTQPTETPTQDINGDEQPF